MITSLKAWENVVDFGENVLNGAMDSVTRPGRAAADNLDLTGCIAR